MGVTSKTIEPRKHLILALITSQTGLAQAEITIGSVVIITGDNTSTGYPKARPLTLRLFLNPFTATACKISGQKKCRAAPANSTLPGPITSTCNAIPFDKSP